VQMIVAVTFTVSKLKLVKFMLFLSNSVNLTCSEDLCKLCKKYLNALRCKFCTFSSQNSQSFDTSHAFLPVIIKKLSTLKNSPFFASPCITDTKLNN